MAAESTDGQRGVLVVSWGSLIMCVGREKDRNTPKHNLVVAQLRQRETDFLTPRLHQV